MDRIDERFREQVAAIQRVMLLTRCFKVDNVPCQIDEVIEFWFLNLFYMWLGWF